MTMFSQKSPFDLSEFLKEPASLETRKQIKSVKSRRQATAHLPEDDAVMAFKKLAPNKH